MFAETASERKAPTTSCLRRAARPKRPAWHYGRFLQADPVGYEAGMNLYAYVLDDPINFIDPSGLGRCRVGGIEIEVCGPPPANQNAPGFRFGVPSSAPYSDQEPEFPLRRAVLLPGPVPEDEQAECGNEDCSEVVVRGRRRSFRSILLGAAASGLEQLAEWLEPPEGRRQGESYGECVNRISGAPAAALGVTGVAGVGAGGPWLGYPRGAFGGGGGGTSLISSAARSLGRSPIGGQFFGSGNIGGVVGRGLSRVSVVGGAAFGGVAVGTTIGALQRCR